MDKLHMIFHCFEIGDVSALMHISCWMYYFWSELMWNSRDGLRLEYGNVIGYLDKHKNNWGLYGKD